MTAKPQPISLVRSPWTGTLDAVVSQAEQHLLIVSPFIKRGGTERVLAQLCKLNRLASLQVDIITDIRPESAIAGSTDLAALADFGRRVRQVGLTHLPSVHAKVYVADCRMAVVTSGNLTESGLRGNIEYGVALAGEPVVSAIRSDFERYASLGAKISVEEVAELSAEMEELKRLFQRVEGDFRRRARGALRKKLDSARVRLLSYRARGKTTHAIFSDTLRFLLAKGPLRTAELHPLVQRLHPDLCNDSVDRIIDGVHFGKKWKHYVRTAQAHLRRRGEIRLERGRWHLVAHP